MKFSIMLNLIWILTITLLLCSHFLCERPNSLDDIPATADTSAKPQNSIDIRIGFIAGSQRAKNDRSYKAPGRNLVHAFNYGIDKINLHQFIAVPDVGRKQGREPRNGTTWNATASIRFLPVMAETFGYESESIKQTIELITKHRVNFIVGPQETCQVESRLAAVYNVGLISHYCPLQYTSTSGGDHASPWQSLASGQQPQPQPPSGFTTFIQSKPPHWKIVQRVVALVGQLLAAYNDNRHNRNGWYPQQLVLLYKQPINGRQPVDKRSANSALNSSSASYQQQNRWQDAYLANDAIQYKLIGDLLEIELKQLFSNQQIALTTNTTSGKQQQLKVPPLTVLNWHTTYYYGVTDNPFRRLIKRHLLQTRYQHASYPTAATVANQSGSQCGDFVAHQPPTPLKGHRTMATKAPAPISPEGQRQKAAIYIIVGHYYEHLGLMLALDALNLLGQQQHQQQPSQQPQQMSQEELQSSVPANHQESLVIGVDIEQYDSVERDDSVHFLRGLLMNEKTSSSEIDSIAHMYRNYMGVVPAKPTRMAEFLDDIRSHYNQTAGQYALRQQQHFDEAAADKSRLVFATNQTTLESVQLTARLLQFIRLPVEAYYLYDSVMLVGAYFHDCLQLKRLTLNECSEGRRAFEWFKNREYFSFVDHSVTRFDSQAQTNGHYTLVAINTNEAADDDFGLVQVGRFVDATDSDEAHKIEFYVDAERIDPIWLPLWCHVRQSNLSECRTLANESNYYNNHGDDQVISDSRISSFSYWLASICCLSVLILVAVVCMIDGGNNFYAGFGEDMSRDNYQKGWFNERDEQNFLEIVHKYLLTPEILQQTLPEDEHVSENINHQEQKSMLELHCHMYSFPSCKFVHWLTALLQLKEMMFQYHSSNLDRSIEGADVEVKTWIANMNKLNPMHGSRHKSVAAPNAAATNRGFFRLKHKGTASLRILLNKYKSINECFCNLNNLDHEQIVKLHGASLNHTVSGGCGGAKIVHLLVEQPDRGSLSGAIKNLYIIMDSNANETFEFRQLVVLSCINDLLDGLEYLHKSKVEFHGELRASNCLLTSGWHLKLSGFHEFHMRRSLGEYEQKSSAKYNLESYYQNLLYSAPEIISNHNKRYFLSSEILKLADLYSVAFVLYELIVGREPWSCLTQVTSGKLLVERVEVDSSFRPPLSTLISKDVVSKFKKIDLDSMQRVVRSCWSQSPDRRPQSVVLMKSRISATLKYQTIAKSQVMKMYANLLEQVSIYRRKCLEQEHQRSLELRLKLLPQSIVAKLNSGQDVPVQRYDFVSLCIFRFVLAADESNPIEQLNGVLMQLDTLVESYRKRVHWMDSQVDSSLRHMIFSGEPLIVSTPPQNSAGDSSKRGALVYNHCQLVASFALQLIDLTNRWQSKFNGSIQVRCGLHCGPVLGGLIFGGRPRPGLQRSDSRAGNCTSSSTSSLSCFNSSARYVIYGNTLHMADMLESSCMAQRIQLSSEYRSQILQNPRIPLECCVDDDIGGIGTRQGYIMIKREAKISSKMFGEFEAYWLLNGPRLTASQSIMLSSE